MCIFYIFPHHIWPQDAPSWVWGFNWHTKQTTNFSTQRNTPLTSRLGPETHETSTFLTLMSKNAELYTYNLHITYIKHVSPIKGNITDYPNHTVRSYFGSWAWLAFEGSETQPTSWRRQSEVMLFIERSNSSHKRHCRFKAPVVFIISWLSCNLNLLLDMTCYCAMISQRMFECDKIKSGLCINIKT